MAGLADHFQLLKDTPESKCAVVYNSLLHADVDPDDHNDDGAKAVTGSNERCAGGDFSNMCGNSLMRSGAAGGGAPDFRQPFFTAANDANLVTCVSNDLD